MTARTLTQFGLVKSKRPGPLRNPCIVFQVMSRQLWFSESIGSWVCKTCTDTLQSAKTIKTQNKTQPRRVSKYKASNENGAKCEKLRTNCTSGNDLNENLLYILCFWIHRRLERERADSPADASDCRSQPPVTCPCTLRVGSNCTSMRMCRCPSRGWDEDENIIWVLSNHIENI